MAKKVSLGPQCQQHQATNWCVVCSDVGTLYVLIVELAASLGAGSEVSSYPRDFRDLSFGDELAFQSMIAERNGKAVGSRLYFDSFPSRYGRRGIYLQDSYVADSERGNGLGRRLLAETAGLGKARGGSYLRLSVDDKNRSAQTFYDKTGLSWASRERIYQTRKNVFQKWTQQAKG